MSIARVLRSLFERLQEQERRLAATRWTGKVKRIDAEKHLVRLAMGKDDDGEDVLSPWIPVGQTAGALKIHSMPSMDQVMTAVSESGDIEQAVAVPYHWSDDNPAPSSDADEHVLTLGDVTIRLVSGGIRMAVGGAAFEMTGSGISMAGASLTHNDKNIGHDHVHRDVTPGGGLSGEPQ